MMALSSGSRNISPRRLGPWRRLWGRRRVKSVLIVVAMFVAAEDIVLESALKHQANPFRRGHDAGAQQQYRNRMAEPTPRPICTFLSSTVRRIQSLDSSNQTGVPGVAEVVTSSTGGCSGQSGSGNVMIGP